VLIWILRIDRIRVVQAWSISHLEDISRSYAGAA
jgi:hypothetical protein